jgi:tetratricopeptide (TPR) repeat protein
MRALSPERDAQKFASAMWRLGRALEQSSRTEAALELYESVVTQPAASAVLLEPLSVRLAELGSKRLADCLERWLSLDAAAAPKLAPRLVELRDAEGDQAGAVRALEAAFAADAANAPVRDRLVDHYERSEQWGRASDALRRAIAASPDDRAALLRWFDVLSRAGAHEERLHSIDVAIVQRPGDVELLALRSSARERAGDIDGAIADLESAGALEPRSLQSLLDLLTRAAGAAGRPLADAHTLRLADLLIRFGRPREARTHLEQLLARSPGRRDVLQKIALAASAERDWRAAGEAHRELLRLAEREDAHDEVARAAVAMFGAYEKAGLLDEARAILRPTIDAWAARGDVSWELERLCEAIGDVGRLAHVLARRADALPASPERYALLTRAARLELDHGGDPAAALASLEGVPDGSVDPVELAALRARANVALGRGAEALALLADAAERTRGNRPQFAAVQLEIARAHLSTDDLVEAFEALKAGFAADWRTGEIAMLLGLVAVDLDDDKTAERALIAVTTMPPRKDAPDGPNKALAFYHLASLAYLRGDVAKAKLLAAKAVGGDPAQQGAARGLLEKLRAL